MFKVDNVNKLWFEKLSEVGTDTNTYIILNNPRKRLLAIPQIKVKLNLLMIRLAEYMDVKDIEEKAIELKRANHVVFMNESMETTSGRFRREFKLSIISGKVYGSFTTGEENVIDKLPYDLFVFTIIQELIADLLELELGYYSHESIPIINKEQEHIRDSILCNDRDFSMSHVLLHMSEYVRSSNVSYDGIVKDSLILSDTVASLFLRGDLNEQIGADIIEKATDEVSNKLIMDLIIVNVKIESLRKGNLLKASKNLEEYFEHDNLMHCMAINNMSNKTLKESRLIIVEGCDGAGKSTFIRNSVMKIVGDETILIDYKAPKDFDKYILFYTSFIHGEVVLDRFILSDIVYSEIFNREPLLNDYDKFIVMKMLKYRNAKTLYINTDYETCFNRLDKNDSEVFTKNMIEGICSMFDRLAERKMFNITKLNE